MRKKQKIRKWVLWLLLIFVLGVVALINYELWQSKEDRFVRYQEFGTDIPVNYAIHGIDVSWHNGRINWPMVKSMEVRGVHLDFVFIKATEGLGRVDAQFRRNWEEAKSAGMIRGPYHFFLATKSGRAQAENFLATVTLESGDIPPVVDVEDTYGVRDTLIHQRLQEWLDVVQANTGTKPIIYTSVDFYDRHLGRMFDGYPLWAAHYLQKENPRIARDWSFWQHSEFGHVSGINAEVDFDVFNGDSLALKQLLMP
ncbi:glycoside hydrolase family 25 protein [Dinghuibacter silviterrae]|uniref:glycoside hydrolase family 25 protein n=1 Tax=Dinghuibacter silviterrae TaxID=1539049 RepID=UPI0013C31ED5|nr:GH25 family lysozyme [Dinghuibacter silviterrae]